MPMPDDPAPTIGLSPGFFHSYTTGEVRYCHDVSCVRPEHPATDAHSDTAGHEYRDGERGTDLAWSPGLTSQFAHERFVAEVEHNG